MKRCEMMIVLVVVGFVAATCGSVSQAAAPWYWDGSTNQWNADFPGTNHWLVSFGGAQNSDLPSGNWNSLYIQSGKVSFSSTTYLGVSGYWNPQSGVMGTTPTVTGGELEWNNGVCDSVGAPAVSGTGVITVKGGLFGGVNSGRAASVGQGGTFNLEGGTLTRPVYVGGTVASNPATTVANFKGGAGPGVTINHGVVNQTGGVVTAVNNPVYGGFTGGGASGQITNPGVITIGTRQHWDSTEAYYYLGDAAGNTGTIGGSKVTVGGKANWGDVASYPATVMKARLIGHGMVTATTLDNNRQVIADGYGVDRTLDLSGVTTIDNSYLNGATAHLYNDIFRSVDGSDGWYARNKGRLLLPTIAVGAGNSVRNWGEPDSDTTIDLINSIRMGFNNVNGGNLSVALLATNHGSVPSLGAGTALGVWSFDASGGFAFGAGSADLTFRYDDIAAGASESALRLYRYVSGPQYSTPGWLDVTSTLDTANNRISANGLNAFSHFAVGTSLPEPVLMQIPEPATVALVLLGVCAVVARRGR